jgi:hypothetical protein
MDELRTKLGGRWCVYCGMAADTLDHFPPRVYTRHGFLLPACRECNVIVGSDFPTDFEKRAALVKQKLARRHARALRFPRWESEEIDQLGYSMRKSVVSWQEKRRIAHARLAWNAVAYILSIAPDKDFVRRFAALGTTITSAA